MPRSDVSEERKGQIISAALEVFSSKGLDKARMDDIAEKSGMSKGALYWYFSGKDDLIIAILDSLFGYHLKDLRHLVLLDTSAEERLWIFIGESLKDLRNMQKLMPLTYEFYALAFRHQAVRKAMKHYLQAYLEILEPIIEQGVKRGEFVSIDPHSAAIAAGAIFEGTLLLWIYDPDQVDLEHNIRNGFKTFLKGMKSK